MMYVSVRRAVSKTLCVYSCLHTCVHAHIHACTQNNHSGFHSHTNTYNTYTYARRYTFNTYKYMHAHHPHVRILTHPHVRMLTHTYAYMYVCLPIRIHIPDRDDVAQTFQRHRQPLQRQRYIMRVFIPDYEPAFGTILKRSPVAGRSPRREHVRARTREQLRRDGDGRRRRFAQKHAHVLARVLQEFGAGCKGCLR